ncbi:MAG: hypothetical protein FVQ85_04100 [Planctomycetes bacterium]|nr:hypothetical protein [Planctomycetota bacterium]
MKRTINAILAKLTGLRIAKAINIKEMPYPLLPFVVKRTVYFYDLLQKIKGIKGEIVECGVGWGRSLFLLSALSGLYDTQRHIYGFDSFQGFPEPTIEDEPERYNIKKGRYTTTKEGTIRYLFNSGIDHDFIDNNITLVEGFFSESLTRYRGGNIALLHLDVDLYQSYKETLKFFYPKVVKGGIIAFDEYHKVEKFSGAKIAIDEFFLGKEKILKSSIINRYYVIKQ